jgi:hypothetical protein
MSVPAAVFTLSRNRVIESEASDKSHIKHVPCSRHLAPNSGRIECTTSQPRARRRKHKSCHKATKEKTPMLLRITRFPIPGTSEASTRTPDHAIISTSPHHVDIRSPDGQDAIRDLNFASGRLARDIFQTVHQSQHLYLRTNIMRGQH